MLKKSDFTSGDTTSPEKGDSAKSTTHALLLKTTWTCPVCKGVGHEFWECATKKSLDKWAKAHNDQHNWGQWKYITYYSGLDEAGRKRVRELSKKDYAPAYKRKKL